MIAERNPDRWRRDEGKSREKVISALSTTAARTFSKRSHVLLGHPHSHSAGYSGVFHGMQEYKSANTMSLETINLPHLPSSLPIHVALYRDVQNAAFLRQQLISANADFEYAFIDASMVCQCGGIEKWRNGLIRSQIFSRAHALSAVFRAVNDYLNGRLKSRNVHSEMVYSLSPTNNVRATWSFIRFGSRG